MSYVCQILPPIAAYFRPWPLALAGFCLSISLFWITSCGIDFDGDLRWSSFTTADWFVLGCPFAAGLALAYAAFIAMLARRVHRGHAWLALALTLALVIVSLEAALPANRVARIIGERAAKRVSINRLRSSDSFNDGVTTLGIITGPEDVFNLIVEDRSLRMTDQSSLNQFRYFDDDEDASIPESGPAYRNERAMFYRHPTTGKIYFRAQSG